MSKQPRLRPELVGIGQRLRDACKMQGLKLERTRKGNLRKDRELTDLANRSGVQAGRISELLCDDVPPGITAATLLALADALDVSAGFLIAGELPMRVEKSAPVPARVRVTHQTEVAVEPEAPEPAARRAGRKAKSR